MQVSCPSCDAPIAFRAGTSVFAVCSYCGSTVVRGDAAVERIGTMAELPEEMTPFQVGTELEHGGTRYTLAGRVRVAWVDGAWNEWFMVGGDTDAWLAEAQGTLAVSFPQDPAQAQGLPAGPPALGDLVTVAGHTYRVTDLKEARCLGSEGELPFRAPRGRAATYADMLGPGGGFAGAEYSADGVQLYAGRYVSFNALRPRNLRPVEGWDSPPPPA